MARIRALTNEYKLTARTLRAVWDSMVAAVRGFADEGRIKFRGRKIGNEAFINAAVWYLADQPRSAQERVLKAYLPRLEAYLSDEVTPPVAAVDVPDPLAPGGGYRQNEPDAPPTRTRRSG